MLVVRAGESRAAQLSSHPWEFPLRVVQHPPLFSHHQSRGLNVISSGAHDHLARKYMDSSVCAARNGGAAALLLLLLLQAYCYFVLLQVLILAV